MSHETLYRYHRPEGPSDRSFGLVFSAAFLFIALLPVCSGGAVRYWPLLAAVVLFGVSCVEPSPLSAPNKVWTAFGDLLHRVVSPVVLAILFFAVIVPYGVVMKVFRKDPLRLRRDSGADSYWVRRGADTSANKGMSHQF